MNLTRKQYSVVTIVQEHAKYGGVLIRTEEKRDRTKIVSSNINTNSTSPGYGQFIKYNPCG
jgi:hypothetical protein